MLQIENYLPALPEAVHISGNYNEFYVELDGEPLDLKDKSRSIWHKSDNYAWGYGGSGPAQLALAILLKYLPIELALQYFQVFKFETVARWPQENINLSFNLRRIMQGLYIQSGIVEERYEKEEQLLLDMEGNENLNKD